MSSSWNKVRSNQCLHVRESMCMKSIWYLLRGLNQCWVHSKFYKYFLSKHLVYLSDWSQMGDWRRPNKVLRQSRKSPDHSSAQGQPLVLCLRYNCYYFFFVYSSRLQLHVSGKSPLLHGAWAKLLPTLSASLVLRVYKFIQWLSFHYASNEMVAYTGLLNILQAFLNTTTQWFYQPAKINLY